MAQVGTRMWYDMGAGDTPLSDGAARSGVRDGRDRQADGAAGTVLSPSASGGGGGALSGGASDRPGGGSPFAGGFPPDCPVDGLPDDGACGQSAADPVANGRADDLPADDPATDIPDRVLPADAPPDGGSPADGSADDPADDGPDDGGVSPVVREYVERLRSEALARDAQLRAQGIDPYKGTPVDEGPRRRLGARALAALVVLVAAVSVGAYVVFLRGEPDYGMSHGYHVQSDGSLKRPSAPVHQPDTPAELLRFTDDASEIAATHYFEAVAYSWNTGDTQYLRAFSSPDCQFCQKTAEDIDRLYSEGGWASGAKFTNVVPHPLGRYSDIENYGEDTYGVRVSFHQLTPDLYAHNTFQASEERDDEVTILVHWDGQRWSVQELGRDQDAEGGN